MPRLCLKAQAIGTYVNVNFQSVKFLHLFADAMIHKNRFRTNPKMQNLILVYTSNDAAFVGFASMIVGFERSIFS